MGHLDTQNPELGCRCGHLMKSQCPTLAKMTRVNLNCRKVEIDYPEKPRTMLADLDESI